MQAEIPIVRLLDVLRREPAGVFSGRTAAWLHGLDMPPCDPIEITLPRNSCRSRLAGVSLTRSDLAPTELQTIQGVAVTAGTRTAADLARRLDLVEGVVALDTVLRRSMTTLEKLRQWVDGHRGYWGVPRLKRSMRLADHRSESPMETRLRVLLVLAGLPRPDLQVPLPDDQGLFIGRPDLYYPQARLAIEYDGATHRSTLVADNRRQNRLLEAGYRLLRFTASDVLHAPAATVAQVERALASR